MHSSITSGLPAQFSNVILGLSNVTCVSISLKNPNGLLFGFVGLFLKFIFVVGLFEKGDFWKEFILLREEITDININIPKL